MKSIHILRNTSPYIAAVLVQTNKVFYYPQANLISAKTTNITFSRLTKSVETFLQPRSVLQLRLLGNVPESRNIIIRQPYGASQPHHTTGRKLSQYHFHRRPLNSWLTLSVRGIPVMSITTECGGILQPSTFVSFNLTVYSMSFCRLTFFSSVLVEGIIPPPLTGWHSKWATEVYFYCRKVESQQETFQRWNKTNLGGSAKKLIQTKTQPSEQSSSSSSSSTWKAICTAEVGLLRSLLNYLHHLSNINSAEFIAMSRSIATPIHDRSFGSNSRLRGH